MLPNPEVDLEWMKALGPPKINLYRTIADLDWQHLVYYLDVHHILFEWRIKIIGDQYLRSPGKFMLFVSNLSSFENGFLFIGRKDLT